MDERDRMDRRDDGDVITGWRAWNLSDGAEGPTLHPLSSDGDPWPPREALRARCEVRPLWRWRRRHAAPASRCRCGVHAARSLEDLDRPRPAWPPAPVVGTVSLWGHVVEHERGWRAALAYPARLRVVCAMCAWFEPGPGLPVVVHRFGRYVYALCDVHEDGIELPDGRTSVPTDADPAELESRLLQTYAVDLLPFEAVERLFRLPRTPDPPPYWPTIRIARRRRGA
jgi:hypothetical protein